MKKLIPAVLIVLLILAVGLPYFFGIKAENHYKEILKKVEKSANMVIKNKSYERGILQSVATNTFEINKGEKTITINNTDTIIHGPINVPELLKGNISFKPFIAHVDSNVNILVPVKTDSGEQKILTIKMKGYTDVSFDRKSVSTYTIPKYKIIRKRDNVTITWSGLDLEFIYDSKLKNIYSLLKSDFLEIKDENSNFSIKNINGKSSTENYNDDLSNILGNFEFDIGSIKFDSLNVHTELDNIQFSGYSKSKDNKLTMGLKITNDKIKYNDYLLGPFIYELIIRNIDTAALIKLRNTTQELNNQDKNDAQNIQLMELLPELVKHSPSIEIAQLKLLSDMGSLDGNAKFTVKGDKPELLQNIFMIGSAIEAEASVTISKSLIDFIADEINFEENDDNDPELDIESQLKITPQDEPLNTEPIEEDDMDILLTERDKTRFDIYLKIQELIDKNIIISDDQNFTFNAKLKSGQLLVNGKPYAFNPMQIN